MKLKTFLTALKIGVNVTKSLATGKVAKALTTADESIVIAEAVARTIKNAARSDKKK